MIKSTRFPHWLLFGILMTICLLCLISNAGAEDYFSISIDSLDPSHITEDWYVSQYLSSSAPGICISKYISDSNELAQSVRLTIVQKNNNTDTLIYDCDYGYQSGTFQSGVIYLPSAQQYTNLYLITLTTSNMTYAFPYVQSQPRMAYNSASTVGVRLMDLSPTLSSDWLMGSMIDLNLLRSQGMQTVPLCASDTYIVGQATIQMNGNQIMVSIAFDANANVEVHSQMLYLLPDCTQTSIAAQPTYSLGQWVDVGDAPSVLLYLPMTISYNASALPTYAYDWYSSNVQNQVRLFAENQGGLMPTQAPSAPSNDPNMGVATDPWSEALPYLNTDPLPPPPEGSEPMRTFTPRDSVY